MKRFIMGLVATLLMLQLPAQDSTTLTAKQVYEDVKDGFSKLVSTLEGPAKHTYVTYVKQHQIKGVTSVVVFILLFALCITIIPWLFKRAEWHEGWPDNGWGLLAVITILGLIATTIGFVASISTVITRTFNPEYYAIQDIISAFK